MSGMEIDKKIGKDEQYMRSSILTCFRFRQ